MKVKFGWISFIPITIASIILKIAQVLFVSDEGATLYGFTSMQLSYLAIGCIVLVLVFSIIFSIIDRKTAPYYKFNRNVLSGILGVIVAVIFACDGANKIFNLVELNGYTLLNVADAIFTLLCAIVFVVIGLSRIIGNTVNNGLAIFYLFPAIWSAIRLINCFLSFTKVSIWVTDVTKLVCYILLTLFLFNFAILVSTIKGKSPVKLNFVYGFSTVTALFVYSIYEIISMIISENQFAVLDKAEVFEFFTLAVFILVFLIELTKGVKTKDEIEIIDIDPENLADEIEEEDAVSDSLLTDDISHTDLITGLDEETKDAAPLHSYLETQDTSDFIYRVMPTSDEANKESMNKSDDYPENTDEYVIDKEVIEDTDLPDIDKYTSQLDDIDKLILNISEERLK